MAEDYYDILGVSKNASQDEIKRAYRKLAMELHPDRNPSKEATEKFKKINESYAVLSDPEKRKQYDMYGPDSFSQHFTQEDIFRNFDIDEVLRNMGFNFGFGNEGTVFDMFGFGTQKGRAADIGSSILEHISVTLKEAAKGTEKKIAVNHIKACDSCSGSGAEKGSRIIRCERCNGTGQQKTTRKTPFGIMQSISTCSKCGGSGKDFEKPCRKCGGRGVIRGQDKIDVKIPKGVSTGSRLRVRGMGDMGMDGAGDLYLDIHVQNDKTFNRDGDDLHVDVHVPFYTAALGGDVTVPTLDGEEKITIPEGTQTGSIISLKGKGMPVFDSAKYGNEVVHVIVDTPTKLSAEQRELLEKFAGIEKGHASSRKKWF
jgi:molecular chaperone DnaJ